MNINGKEIDIRKKVNYLSLAIMTIPLILTVLLSIKNINSIWEKVIYVCTVSIAGFLVTNVILIRYIEKLILITDEFEVLESSHVLDRMTLGFLILLFTLVTIFPLMGESNVLYQIYPNFLIFQMATSINRNRLMIGTKYAIVGNRILNKTDILGYRADKTNNKAISTTILMENNKSQLFLLYQHQIQTLVNKGIQPWVQDQSA